MEAVYTEPRARRVLPLPAAEQPRNRAAAIGNQRVFALCGSAGRVV